MLWRDYFHYVRPTLECMGLDVMAPRLKFGGTIIQRAADLCRQLADAEGPLHLIAHSMGGLDARHYITHMGGHEKVASLTTLSTPHRGSSAANYVLGGKSLLKLLPSMRYLTPEAAKEFNEQTPDHPSVGYYSYTASRPLHELPYISRRYGRHIHEWELSNDSQVSRISAIWGKRIGHLHADHFEVVGMNLWLHPFRKRQRFDHLPTYREIGERILNIGTSNPIVTNLRDYDRSE